MNTRPEVGEVVRSVIRRGARGGGLGGVGSPAEMASIEWGPVATWVAAVATFLTALIAILVAQGRFAGYRAPRIRITFADAEPWCRTGEPAAGRQVLWARVGVENVGRSTAHGCVGRLMGVTTDGDDSA